MATQKQVLESLVNRDEILYWAKKNNVQVEEIPGGFVVGEWKINLKENNITSVERVLDEPQSL